MKPVIGITVEGGTAQGEPQYDIRRAYADAVAEAGGVPVLLPWGAAPAGDLLPLCHGILISGGAPGVSVTPGRTDFEIALLRGALDKGLPVLGICNGMQLPGQLLGGTLTTLDDPTRHRPASTAGAPAHEVRIEPGTRLAALGAPTALEVNSLHLQALFGHGRFRVAARAGDGVIEAIEGPRWSLGLQWHPEFRLTAFDRAIFSEFIHAAGAG